MQEWSFPRLLSLSRAFCFPQKCEGGEPAIAQCQEHLPGDGSSRVWVDASPNRKDTSQLSEMLPVTSKAQDRKVCYPPRCQGLPQPCPSHVTTGLHLSHFMPQFFTLKHRANPTSPSLECCHEDKGRGCLAVRA